MGWQFSVYWYLPVTEGRKLAGNYFHTQAAKEVLFQQGFTGITGLARIIM